MTTAAAVNVNDLEALIRDNVQKAIADGMTSALETARDTAARAVAEGNAAQLAAVAKAAATGERVASVDTRTFEVLHDPHAGKGLGWARAVKATAAARSLNRDPRDLARSWARDGFAHYGAVADALDTQARAMAEGSFGAGGALVPQQQSAEIIELLYAATQSLKLGARVIEFNAALNMGKMNAGATVGYVGESDNIVPSQPAVGEIRLSRKKAAATVPLTNELLRNPAVGADAIVRDDLVRQIALRRDLSFFRGQGTQAQPKGVLNWTNASNKFNQAGTTTANKIADLIKLIRLVDESNIPLDSAAFAMAPRSLWSLASSLDANSNMTFAAMLAAGNLFGFKYGRSTQIPTNLGGGTNESEIYFGAFSDALMGFDSSTPLAIEVFPNGTFFDGSALVSGISSDQTVIRALEGHDVALRHDTSFAICQAVTWP
jgi:HK97 family phage major capsid protein